MGGLLYQLQDVSMVSVSESLIRYIDLCEVLKPLFQFQLLVSSVYLFR